MPAASLTRALYLTHFCAPKCDRSLFRAIKKLKPKRIVEIGVEPTRASRVLELAARHSPHDCLQYTGIDFFDARPEQPLKLKAVHQRLSKSGAKIRLVPGDLLAALARTANELTATDLIIVDASYSDEELQRVGQFIPRMVTGTTRLARYVQRGNSIQVEWPNMKGFQAERRHAA